MKSDHAVALQAQALLHYWVAQVHFHVKQGVICRQFYTYIFSLTSQSGVGRKSFTNQLTSQSLSSYAPPCDLENVSTWQHSSDL